MPPRKRTSTRSSRQSSVQNPPSIDTVESDVEHDTPATSTTTTTTTSTTTATPAATSPATSLEEEKQDATYDPTVEDQVERDAIAQDSNSEPSAVPGASKSRPDGPANKTLKAAFREMVQKAALYMNRIEEHKAKMKADRGEVDDDEDEHPETATTASGGKKRKAASTRAKASNKKKKTASAPPPRLPQSSLITGGTLKDYQLDGMNWIIERYIYALYGAILADEMGTGKTLQTISFIAFLHEQIHRADRPETDRPTLIILPKAVLGNWEAEFARFAPDIPVLAYAGTPEERSELRRTHLGIGGVKRAKAVTREHPYPVILITYQIAMKDVAFLESLNYDLVVCDEAHKAKNLKGKTLAALKRYKADFRLLLTGTPLQNNLTELYSLLSFILPEIFTDQETFESMFNFSSLTNSDGSKLSEQDEVTLMVAQLQNILRPFMLRRCKKDVVKDLPLKKEYVLTAPLTARQKELTDAAVKGELRTFLTAPAPQAKREEEEAKVDLAALASTGRGKRRKARQSYVEKGDAVDDDEFENDLIDLTMEQEREKEKTELAKLTSRPAGNLNHKQAKFSSVMTNLRQIANHPLLKLDDRSELRGSDASDIVDLSGKMMLLDRLLPELFKRGHKVLIFSQFTKMLDLLDEYIIDVKGWTRFRIDGQQGHAADQDEIDEFNSSPVTDESTNIFLLSTRAGGVGINLVGADTVILFDSDWNPQNDLQAMDRAHRIGQTKPVLVFRLASANTVEQTILANATRKRRLERVVLGTDSLAGDAGDILNKAKGKKANRSDSVRLLAEQLANAEGEKITLAGAGAEILTDAQLEALLDRSEEAMKSDTSSTAQKEGKSKSSTTAAFEVVETIEEEEVQTKNVLADLLEDEDDEAPQPVATDDDDE
ncbi:hypothetical protein JCM10212_001125 [Sporobolomyces blumeae]